MATEWQVDNLTVVQAARKIDEISGSSGIEFRRRREDANIVEFAILPDKSTYSGYVAVADTAIGRRQRLRVTVDADPAKDAPKPSGLGGLFAKKPTYAARPDVLDKATEQLKAALPPI
ncbi:MAG TPA: hypothetical protein VFC93_01570 [Chloroflexota bacterium]|nr:hypothetical protein [Chloroflexota bacterium]